MEWQAVLFFTLALLLVLFLSGIQVAFAFMLLNMIGIVLWMGGPKGLTLLVPSAFTSVAYFALVGADKLHLPGGRLRAADDAADVGWFSATAPPALAFDHAAILNYAITRLRYKLEYTALGFQLLPERFTLRELQAAYETVLGEKLDKGNFRSKLRKSGVVEPAGGYRPTGGRPARLYHFRDDAVAEVKTRRLFP